MTFKPRTFHGEAPEGTINGPAEAVLESIVADRIAVAPDLDASDISVTASSGFIRLDGMVQTEAEIDKAIAIARSVLGVKGVESNLGIKSMFLH